MITTYDLRDPATQQVLADDLRALGFDAAVRTQPDSEQRLTVTHPIEEAGRLDGLVYEAEPTADIAGTLLEHTPVARPPRDAPPIAL